jgi:hypothetical protein
MNNPNEVHLKSTKHILWYIKGSSLNLGYIFFMRIVACSQDGWMQIRHTNLTIEDPNSYVVQN